MRARRQPKLAKNKPDPVLEEAEALDLMIAKLGKKNTLVAFAPGMWKAIKAIEHKTLCEMLACRKDDDIASGTIHQIYGACREILSEIERVHL